MATVDPVAGYSYPAAQAHLSDPGADVSGLRLAVLSSAHTPNTAQTSAAAILADEVSSADWPAGGLAVPPLQVTFPGSAISRVMSSFEIPLLSGAFAFRYALLYDPGLDLPLALFDYADGSATQGKKLTFSETATPLISTDWS